MQFPSDSFNLLDSRLSSPHFFNKLFQFALNWKISSRRRTFTCHFFASCWVALVALSSLSFFVSNSSSLWLWQLFSWVFFPHNFQTREFVDEVPFQYSSLRGNDYGCWWRAIRCCRFWLTRCRPRQPQWPRVSRPPTTRPWPTVCPPDSGSSKRASDDCLCRWPKQAKAEGRSWASWLTLSATW